MADFVQARSDNLPAVDILMVMEFISSDLRFTSSEIRNVKSDRSMRDNYVTNAVGRVCLRRDGHFCHIKGQVCPEHRQSAVNYDVSMIVDEEEECIIEINCHGCTASSGGCKHSLAFLMWVHTKSTAPAPTEVESYWSKPKLSNVSRNLNLRTSDFGRVPSITVNCSKFMERVKAHQATSYDKNLTDVHLLDLHILLIQYKKHSSDSSPNAFRSYASSKMTSSLIKEAYHLTIEQSESRYWHLFRYGRISASRLHTVAHSKTPDGGVLKEYILGAKNIKCTKAMARGLSLEKDVLKIIEKTIKCKIRHAGLLLSSDFPEFGASPDGICEEYVIEVKCPLNEKNMKYYIKNGHITSKFKAQINLQMFLSNKKKAIFCVAHPSFEKTKQVTILYEDFDKNYIIDIMKVGRNYWDNNIFPLLYASA